MKTCYWIWYPGDFELYHAMKQNFSREERGYGRPAMFWWEQEERSKAEVTENPSLKTSKNAPGLHM